MCTRSVLSRSLLKLLLDIVVRCNRVVIRNRTWRKRLLQYQRILRALLKHKKASTEKLRPDTTSDSPKSLNATSGSSKSVELSVDKLLGSDEMDRKDTRWNTRHSSKFSFPSPVGTREHAIEYEDKDSVWKPAGSYDDMKRSYGTRLKHVDPDKVVPCIGAVHSSTEATR